MKTAKTLSWIVALFGVWEVLAPFVLGYSAATVALWNAIVLGVVLVVLGVWAAVAQTTLTLKTLDWINTVLGIWLIVAPFILSYTGVTAALWNDIIVGIVVAVLAAWAALTVSSTDQERPMHAG